MNECIIHVRDRAQHPDAVYIGRANGRYRLKASVWANRYQIGIDGTREECIAQYRQWLLAQPLLIARLPELRSQTLMCWCKPEACHGDVLIQLLDELYPEQQRGDK